MSVCDEKCHQKNEDTYKKVSVFLNGSTYSDEDGCTQHSIGNDFIQYDSMRNNSAYRSSSRYLIVDGKFVGEIVQKKEWLPEEVHEDFAIVADNETPLIDIQKDALLQFCVVYVGNKDKKKKKNLKDILKKDRTIILKKDGKIVQESLVDGRVITNPYVKKKTYKIEVKDEVVLVGIQDCRPDDSGIYSVDVIMQIENEWMKIGKQEQKNYDPKEKSKSIKMYSNEVNLMVIYQKPSFTKKLEKLGEISLDPFLQEQIEIRKQRLLKQGFYDSTDDTNSEYYITNTAKSQEELPLKFSCEYTGMPIPEVEWFEKFEKGRLKKINLNNNNLYSISNTNNQTVLVVNSPERLLDRMVTLGNTNLSGKNNYQDLSFEEDVYEMELVCRAHSLMGNTSTRTRLSCKGVWPHLLLQQSTKPVEGDYGSTVNVRALTFGLPKPTIKWFLNHKSIDGSCICDENCDGLNQRIRGLYLETTKDDQFDLRKGLSDNIKLEKYNDPVEIKLYDYEVTEEDMECLNEFLQDTETNSRERNNCDTNKKNFDLFSNTFGCLSNLKIKSFKQAGRLNIIAHNSSGSCTSELPLVFEDKKVPKQDNVDNQVVNKEKPEKKKEFTIDMNKVVIKPKHPDQIDPSKQIIGDFTPKSPPSTLPQIDFSQNVNSAKNKKTNSLHKPFIEKEPKKLPDIDPKHKPTTKTESFDVEKKPKKDQISFEPTTNPPTIPIIITTPPSPYQSLHFLVFPREVKCFRGDSVAFECTVCSSYNPIVKWYKNGKELRSSYYPDINDIITILENTNSPHNYCPKHDYSEQKQVSLIMNHVSEGGVITVVVEARGEKVECTTSLVVEDEPTEVTQVRVEMEDQVVREGEKCIFRLDYQKKKDCEINWYHNEKLLEKSKKYIISTTKEGFSLEIPKTTLWDTGVYRLDVTEGRVSSSYCAQLTVDDGSPNWKIKSFPRDQKINEGDDFVSTIQTSGKEVKEIIWFKNLYPIRKSDEKFKFSIDDLTSTYSLTVFQALKQDEALYSVKIRCDDEEKVVSWYLKVDEPKTQPVKHRLIQKKSADHKPKCHYYDDVMLIEKEGGMMKLKVLLEIECHYAIKKYKDIQSTQTQRRWLVKKKFIPEGNRDEHHRLLGKWFVDSSTEFEFEYSGPERNNELMHRSALFKQQKVLFKIQLLEEVNKVAWFKDGELLVEDDKLGKSSVRDTCKYKVSYDGMVYSMEIFNVNKDDAGVYTFALA